ncbi:hypothetical protein SAZ11_61040 [Streptomyces sp. FXJ1.4098]|nr:hypothetical protein [Streptomyces sp. FXJ1.4098]
MASAALPVLPDPQEGALFVTQLAADAAADSETVEVAAVSGLDPDDLPPDVWVQIGSGRFKVQVGQPADGKVTLTLPSGTAHEAWRRGWWCAGCAGAPPRRGRRCGSAARVGCTRARSSSSTTAPI